MIIEFEINNISNKILVKKYIMNQIITKNGKLVLLIGNANKNVYV